MDCPLEVLAQVDVRFLFDLSLHSSWRIKFLCDQMARIRANIVSICSHISALRWIRPAGMSIYLKQVREHFLIDHPFLSLRVDYILKFRFPPYNVGNLLLLSAPHWRRFTPSKFKWKQTNKTDATLRLMKSSLPARPTGPPAVPGTNKWWGKWFILAFAVAVVGGLTSRLKMGRLSLSPS